MSQSASGVARDMVLDALLAAIPGLAVPRCLMDTILASLRGHTLVIHARTRGMALVLAVVHVILRLAARM